VFLAQIHSFLISGSNEKAEFDSVDTPKEIAYPKCRPILWAVLANKRSDLYRFDFPLELAPVTTFRLLRGVIKWSKDLFS